MGTRYQLKVTWQGDYGNDKNNHKGYTVFNDIISAGSASTLSGNLETYTDCNRANYAYNQLTYIDETKPGNEVSVDKRAILYMRNLATLEVVTLTIPGIKEAYIEKAPQGRRLTAAALAALETLINAHANDTYAVMYGKVKEPS